MGISLLVALVLAQSEVGPHYRQAEPHRGEPPPTYQVAPLTTATVVTPQMKRRVYGFLPYWGGVDPNTLRWDVLTDVIHFDVELSTAGAINTTNGFVASGSTTSNLVTIAHQHSARAHFAVTVPGGCNTFLSSSTAQTTAITNLVKLAKQTQADGIDVDFEFVSSTYASAFTTFIKNLAGQLHTALPNAELTIAMPSYPPWYPGYQVSSLASAADRLLLMEYDFHYSGSSTAGPVAPLTGGANWTLWVKKCLASSSSGYLAYATAGKLALGVPYYGYDWPTSSATAVPSSATGSGSAIVYSSARSASVTDGARWDSESLTPWYSYTGSSPHQVWWENATSLSDKYDYVNQQNLSGVMIWALGYDSGRTELWDLLKSKFGIPDGGTDAGTPDAGATDAGSAPDAGARDAGPAPDAGAVDAGPAPDAGLLDGGAWDAGGPDAGDVDAGEVDAGDLDAGNPDAGTAVAGDGGLDDGGAAGNADSGTALGDGSGGFDDGPVTGGCGVAPVGSSLLVLLGLALSRRRRRARSADEEPV